MLITGECVEINNLGRIYTDCMEFSLLRFFQLMLCDEESIKTKSQSKYLTNKEICLPINDFIKKYPIIYSNIEYYSSEKGILERQDWAKTLSDTEIFEYYRNDKAELFTNVENIVQFINWCFFTDFNIKSEINVLLQQIQDYFTLGNKKITLTLDSKSETKLLCPVSQISQFISRPDNEYSYFNTKRYFVSNVRSIIKIKINYCEYEWNLYEKYMCNKNKFSNHFITGHSVIYNC